MNLDHSNDRIREAHFSEQARAEAYDDAIEAAKIEVMADKTEVGDSIGSLSEFRLGTFYRGVQLILQGDVLAGGDLIQKILDIEITARAIKLLQS